MNKINRHLKIILIILSIAAIIIPTIFAYGKLNQKVEDSTERINNYDSRIIELEKIVAGTEVSLTNIEKDIGEIKSDIKYLINNPEGKK